MRFTLLLVALSLWAQPCLAQANLEVPVCQWGNCAKFCDPACGAGSVCSVEGKCVEQKTDEQRESEAIDRRHQARSLTRISAGVSVGQAQVEGTMQANLFGLELGWRQQLAAYVGLSAHLGAAYADLNRAFTVNPTTSAASYSDFWVDFIPYLGPLGRFYVGPALVLAYRHYAAPVVYSGYTSTSSKGITSRFRVETGGRLGLLLGNREQFDLWLQETTSVSDTTLNQTLLGFSVEFF